MLNRSDVLRALRDPQHTQGRRAKRWQEIYTLYWFSEFFSHKHGEEYMIGVRVPESTVGPIPIARIFDPDFGLDDDVDLVLGPEILEPQQPRGNELRVQITRLFKCDGGTESLKQLLSKKVHKAQSDPSLLLLVSLDESGAYNYREISRFLHEVKCPFGQVFLIGSDDKPYTHTVFYVQVYPALSDRWNKELAWP